MTVDYRIGDVRDVMASIPDGSVSLVATSPPFLVLRSYLPAGHDAKHQEIGSEPDPAAFLDTLLELTAEWGRVLAPWGSIAIELGDTYSGNNESGWERDKGVYRSETRSAVSATGALQGVSRTSNGWPRPKCLALIPQLYAIALAYGINPLTGQPSPAGRWLVRNVIVWHRPNPAVGALGDKFRPSTSYIVVATRSAKRWFDLTVVRTDAQQQTPRSTNGPQSMERKHLEGGSSGFNVRLNSNPAGAPPLDTWLDHHDTWTLTTQPSSLAHYAMWPAKLAERLILSMCPAEVCAVCGGPRRRVERCINPDGARLQGSLIRGRNFANPRTNEASRVATIDQLGWTDCGHNAFIPGVTLDPFSGTGTTIAVADLHGRDAIGIDLDPRNEALYERRREECHRALFGTQPELPGQMEMFA